MTNPWEVKADHGATQFVEQQRAELFHQFAKIEHCFKQLSDEDIWWRPFEAHNAIGNIVLHLCGNMRQWMIHGIPGGTDDRDRPSEFTSREPMPKAELLAKLRRTVEEADRTLATLLEGGAAETAKWLMATRRIQGFNVHVQAAILHSVAHLNGHAQEIIWITRFRVGESYQFMWAPTTPEQGA